MRAAGTDFLFATDGSVFNLRPLTGGPAIHFERHESVTLTRPQLQQYAGEYVSEELGGAEYAVAVADSTLSFRIRSLSLSRGLFSLTHSSAPGTQFSSCGPRA
jgi:hypothetical protein